MVAMPVPKFEPGRARFNPSVTDDVLNVLPAIDGYKPLPSLKAFVPAFEVLSDAGDDGVLATEDDFIIVTGPDGAALSGEVQLLGTLGGIFVRLSDGTQACFVGTQNALYRLNFTDYTWEDVSGTSGPYNVGADKRWSFALFGNSVHAQNFNDPEQVFDVTSDSVFSDNATAPICAYLAVFGSFMLRGRLLSDETAVQWSAPEDPTSNEAGIDNSDIQSIPEGGEVTGIVPTTGGFVVFKRDAVNLMNFAPSSGLVFLRQVVSQYRGCIAPYSVQLLGQDDFAFYSKDGWFRGLQMQPIGAERIDPWFQENVGFDSRAAMISGADYRRKVGWWRYLAPDNTYRMLGYHWQLDQWTFSDADLADMFQAETAGVTIDQIDNFFPTVDDIDVPYDSSFWDGGAPEFAGITSQGFLAFMNGQPMAARISTNSLNFGRLGGAGRSFVNEVRLVTDATDVTMTHSVSTYKGAPFIAKAPISQSARSRRFATRGNGEQHRFLFNFPEGAEWTTVTEIMPNAGPSGDL